MPSSRFREHVLSTHAILVYLFLLTIVGLWPYQFRSCISCPNGAVLIPNVGIFFATPGIVIDRDGGNMINRDISTGDTITVLLHVESREVDQYGPARILSLSNDTFNRNLTLGQEGNDLVFRLRTPTTGPNGTDHELVASDAIHPGNTQVFAATYDGDVARLFVDGVLRAQEILPAGDFSVWDLSYPLIFGNELTGDRPWLGTIRDVAVYARALSAEELHLLPSERLHKADGPVSYHLGSRCLNPGNRKTGGILFGPCERPEMFTNAGIAPMLGFEQRQVSDYVKNMLLYVLPGVVLILARLGARRRAAMLSLIVLHPALIEIAQSLVVIRTSSFLDMLTAWIGLAGGAALAKALLPS